MYFVTSVARRGEKQLISGALCAFVDPADDFRKELAVKIR
jgi:hypothetical protein